MHRSIIAGTVIEDDKANNHIGTIYSPLGRKKIGEIEYASAAQCERAIIAATESFRRTRSLSSMERNSILLDVSRRISDQKEALAKLISMEAGKPITLARVEVERAILTFALAAEESRRIGGEVVPLDWTSASRGKVGIVQRVPRGIVLAITPFNYPLNLAAHKIAPAMAVGAPFILKPALQTPLTALMLGQMIRDSGYPPEAINVIICDNVRAEELVKDERIAMLSFTGSAEVGWKLKPLAGRKMVTLELGGNASSIVDESADMQKAAVKLVKGAFIYSGQVCIKAQKIYLKQSIAESFKKKFIEETKALAVGEISEKDVVLNPLIDENAERRVNEWVKEAIAKGGQILYERSIPGSLCPLRIVDRIPHNCRLFTEEIFGPVVTFHEFRELEEAIEEINRGKYGLQASIFSNSHESIMLAYRSLEAGAVIVNDSPSFRVDQMPYGGIKESGFGREGVRYAIEEMTVTKMLVVEQ